MSDRIAIFAGPSLPPCDRPDHPALTWLPPAATGDVLKLVGQGFDTICLIDGYFDHRPAPWHKELLTAMAAGIRLIGASSMGALRAAELDRYGMIGVGSIYRAYRSGLLTGDDEVALVHGPQSIGWAAASVAMVEVRATLLAAVRAQIVDAKTARAMRTAAHGIHYADRDWPLMAAAFEQEGIADAETSQTIAAMHVPLKRRDAERCVAAATASDQFSLPNYDVPRTCFLRDLEGELGLS